MKRIFDITSMVVDLSMVNTRAPSHITVAGSEARDFPGRGRLAEVSGATEVSQSILDPDTAECSSPRPKGPSRSASRTKDGFYGPTVNRVTARNLTAVYIRIAIL